ncbi:hypothetical protein LJY25_03640 [Hymenobacter sp. BT175]|uniref:hypothetical protein n=1 Tax=Hymenobacter translucens TaxID=2886507 RepID=UPI001D0E1610|nr:hypothetical protein [Hymenobacter translucens]MCC2545524.1 hypothetical protein [Hymenobacter translucens]
MSPSTRFVFSLRFALLTLAALLSLGLNQREVNTFHQPGGNEYGTTVQSIVEVVKKKVALEATPVLSHYVAPPALAWLPVPALAMCWLPRVRRILATPLLQAGVQAAEVFRVRLLAVMLSPQAP